MSDQPSAHRPDTGGGRHAGPPSPASAYRDNSGWATGGVLLAGVLMLVHGVLSVLQGIAAITKDNVYVNLNDYIYRVSLTGWGWTLLILGAITALVGIGILADQSWARMTGILLAALGLIAQFLFLPYAPVWSIAMMALAVFVIWALSTYHPDRDRVG
ncbi:hypothetical protein [Streptomyces sp. NPDC057702]|uniref:DUF7144 family membrane protein n=1 Tax=unclassified Streptomyces TaxID=2593676 RepID=UPI00369C3268